MPEAIQPVLHNTLTRQTAHLENSGQEVTIYTCGPTVYNDQHIGNYRTFIFEDVLVKSLRWLGFKVKRVMNITDVGHLTSDEDQGEDKLEVGARREGTTAWEIAKKYEKHFIADLRDLKIEKPTLIRATETIPEQIALIQTLERRGFTYQTSDGVYYDSSRFPNYRAFARLDITGMQAGTRVDMGEKRHITDFALWKFSSKGSKRDMEWASPWGVGFPGWHVECSAIAMKALGDQITIHTGGVDHIPVHHTNEIAQTEAATGKKSFAKIWMHGEFLLVDGGKMSKSLGNVYLIEDLKKRGFDPLALRMLFYSASYRAKQNFTWEGLQAAQTSLERLRQFAQESDQEFMDEEGEKWLRQIRVNLANDLNMPAVMAQIWEMVHSELPTSVCRAILKEFDQVLSLDLFKVTSLQIPKEVTLLVKEREKARQNKEWQASDELRTKIAELGYEMEDLTDGKYKVRQKNKI